jgi:hypothetical protein
MVVPLVRWAEVLHIVRVVRVCSCDSPRIPRVLVQPVPWRVESSISQGFSAGFSQSLSVHVREVREIV